MRDDGQGGETLLAGTSERLRRRDPVAVVEEVFGQVLETAGVRRDELDYVATTGEGEDRPLRAPATSTA